MEIHINDIPSSIAEIEIALRYAASDTTDADLQATLLIAAAALQKVEEAAAA